jgi:hypothetical protein
MKFVVASSLAVLASGASLPVPSFRNIATKARAQVRAERDSIRSAKGKDASSVSIEALLEKEGISLSAVNKDSSMKYFEVTMGQSDCDSTVGEVMGIAMDRCADGIFNPDGEDRGEPESEIIYAPKNGGFPIMVFFEGHGCEKDNAYHTFRLNKQDFGFYPTYKPAGT